MLKPALAVALIVVVGLGSVYLLRLPPSSKPASKPIADGPHLVAGPVDLAAPAGAIVLTPETENIEEIIGQSAENAIIVFAAGTYHDLQIEPKRGQTYLGEKGAILFSSKKSYAFECFDNPADSVTIQNLTIDGYLPPYQCALIQAGVQGKCGTHWLVKNCEIRNCLNGGGIQLFDDSTIDACYVHHCDQLGVKMFGRSPSIRNSVITHNNFRHKFDVFNEAGGSKFWDTRGLVCENNEWALNVGCGVWCDFQNEDATVRGNYCHDNTLAGIYQEIGGSMLIENNHCINNGTEFRMSGWLHGGGISVEASQNVVIRNNIIADNANGIGLIATNRGRPDWVLANIEVYGNTVSMERGATGVCWDGKAPEPWSAAKFHDNTFQLARPAMFQWQGKLLTLAAWQAAGLAGHALGNTEQ